MFSRINLGVHRDKRYETSKVVLLILSESFICLTLNSRVAKEVVFCSQSVGEEIQALFSIAVDLKQTVRKIYSCEKENFAVTTI